MSHTAMYLSVCALGCFIFGAYSIYNGLYHPAGYILLGMGLLINWSAEKEEEAYLKGMGFGST